MKFLRLMEIVADAQNSGGIAAEICCGKFLRKIAAENCCGKLLRKIAVEICCGKLLLIYRIHALGNMRWNYGGR